MNHSQFNQIDAISNQLRTPADTHTYKLHPHSAWNESLALKTDKWKWQRILKSIPL